MLRLAGALEQSSEHPIAVGIVEKIRELELVIPAVVQRGGDDGIDFSILEPLVDSARLEIIRSHVIKMPVIELSSSDLRSRISSGKRIRFRVPRAVESFIEAGGLYRTTAE